MTEIKTGRYSHDNTLGITINYILSKNNVSKNRLLRISKVRKLLMEEVAKLYIEGNDYEAIKNKIGLAKKTVSEWITKYGAVKNLLESNYNKLAQNEIYFESSHSFGKIDLRKNRIKFEMHNKTIRTADYILWNLQKIFRIIVSFLTNDPNTYFRLSELGSYFQIPTNFLIQILEKGLIHDFILLSNSERNTISKYKLGFIKTNWIYFIELILMKSKSYNSIIKDTKIDLTPQVKRNSSLRISSFFYICKFYKINPTLIDYTIVEKKVRSKNDKIYPIKADNITAELVGIILGDGHLSDEFKITLNFNQKYIIKRVKYLLEEVFGSNFRNKKRKKSNACDFRTGKKDYIAGLLAIGIKKGRKSKLQVDVPVWIKNDLQFSTACIRGLFDSDGSIFFSKYRKIPTLDFTNTCIPLLVFFQNYLDKHGIKCSRYSKSIQIRDRDAVQLFLSLVSPVKLLEAREKYQHPYFDNKFLIKVIHRVEKMNGLARI